MNECDDCPEIDRERLGMLPLSHLSDFLKNRAALCARCEHRTEKTLPRILVKVETCKLCGCQTIMRRLTTCPDGKW